MGLVNIRPLRDYMVVERDDPPELSPGGINLMWKEDQGEGTVKRIGPEVTGCKVDDHVYFSPYLWNSTRVSEDNNLMVLNEDQILGVVI